MLSGDAGACTGAAAGGLFWFHHFSARQEDENWYGMEWDGTEQDGTSKQRRRQRKGLQDQEQKQKQLKEELEEEEDKEEGRSSKKEPGNYASATGQ